MRVHVHVDACIASTYVCVCMHHTLFIRTRSVVRLFSETDVQTVFAALQINTERLDATITRRAAAVTEAML